MAKKRAGRKTEVPPEISVYFRALARRSHAARGKEKMRDQYYKNGLDRYQFQNRKPFECGHPRSPENEFWLAANHAVCRRCKSSASLAASLPTMPSLAELQQNQGRYDEFVEQSNEERLRDQQAVAQQAAVVIRAKRKPAPHGIWLPRRGS